MNKTLKLVLAAGSLVTSVVLAGCGLGTTTSQAFNGGGATPSANMAGKVKGGQQPVAGSTLHMYAASTSGYGAAAYDMQPKDSGNNTPTTDANGSFQVASYTCSSPCGSSSEVLLVMSGGNAGAGANSNAVWMMALGPQSGISGLPFLQVNEITTVATAYALAPFFGSDYTYLGTSSTNVTGLQNAFSLVNSLVNIGTGWGGGTALPGGATVTTDSLYALADVIAACVNSSGGTSAGTNCGNLLNCSSGASCSCAGGSCTTGGSAPADTATAAVNLAKNATLNVSSLWNLIPGTPVFTYNGLTSAPNDWTLAINYTDSSLNGAAGSAVDGSGNLWVANTGSSQVTKITPSGSVASYSLALAPNALAVDAGGHVWVAAGSGTGTSSAALYELSSSGSQITTCSDVSLNDPTAVTVDSTGNIWLSNTGAATLSEFNSSCTFVNSYSGAGVSGGIAIAAGAH